ncbi:hypothetical protein V6Z11_D02G082300 [Gossypium hirsutum]
MFLIEPIRVRISKGAVRRPNLRAFPYWTWLRICSYQVSTDPLIVSFATRPLPCFSKSLYLIASLYLIMLASSCAIEEESASSCMETRKSHSSSLSFLLELILPLFILYSQASKCSIPRSLLLLFIILL